MLELDDFGHDLGLRNLEWLPKQHEPKKRKPLSPVYWHERGFSPSTLRGLPEKVIADEKNKKALSPSMS